EYQIMRCLQARVVHAMQLAGGKEHNPPRADVLLSGSNRSGNDDDRNVVLIDMGGISAAWLQYGLVRMQLRSIRRRRFQYVANPKRSASLRCIRIAPMKNMRLQWGFDL